VLYRPDTLYAGKTFFQHFDLPWLHYIDVMVFVLVSSVLMALADNHLVLGNRAIFIFSREGRALRAAEA
jgi:solute:Na+ symporter, SSS family